MKTEKKKKDLIFIGFEVGSLKPFKNSYAKSVYVVLNQITLCSKQDMAHNDLESRSVTLLGHSRIQDGVLWISFLPLSLQRFTWSILVILHGR